MKKGQEIAVKEMDREISVDVEIEERPLTSLNIYGSPVASLGRRQCVHSTIMSIIKKKKKKKKLCTHNRNATDRA